MKRIVIFCALCALWGCRKANIPQTDPIALYYSTAEQSKTDLLTQGEQIGVFAAVAGTERYFLDNTQYIVEADGRSLSTAPAVYYPEAKQAVTFMAYLPFGGTWDGGVGTFSVSSDQTTALALKEADLCWAKASSTPVAAPVALEFRHQMARLLITTNEPTEKIAIPNAFSGGILDIKTGTFTNTLRSEVFTTGNELIVPAQPLTRLLLTVSGVEHPFTPAVPLDLPAGQTTTLNLTLNPTTKTATLASTTTTQWSATATTGDPYAPVSNAFTMHYAPAPADYATADKVTLTVQHPVSLATQDIDLVPALVVGQSSAAACGYTFALQLPVASGVPYPYVVSRVRLYAGSTVLRDTPQKYLKGSLVYRSGAQTLAHYITIKVRDEVTNTTEIKNWAGVMGGGEQQLVKVTVEGADTWTATATGTGVGTTASGANGAIGAIYWARNPSTTAGRSGSLTFSTVPNGATLTIPTNQLAQATPPGTILVNGVSICTGNLIADGPNGCKIGAPTDFGLYFKFGSLIGWSGGANGDGTGAGQPALSQVVTSLGYNGGSTWLDTPYSTIINAGSWMSINSASGGGNDPEKGTGDPCSFYLGAAYRVPTRGDAAKIFGTIDGKYSEGWSYSSSRAINGSLSLMAAGYRREEGRFESVNHTGEYELAAAYVADRAPTTNFRPDKFYTYGGNSQKWFGNSVRCVAN